MLNFELIVWDQSETHKTLNLGYNLTPEQVKKKRLIAEEVVRRSLEMEGKAIDDPLESSIITWGTPESAD